MDRRPLTEIFVSALIAVVCAVFLVQALALPPGRFEPMGSGPVPTWTALVVIACCLVVIIRAAKSLGVVRKAEVVESELAGMNPVGGVLMLGLTFVYVAALQFKLAGFGVITFVYLLLLILGMERFARRSVLPAVILSALAAFGAQYVFTEIFVVDLPV
jgi:hypothetical protein